jgi:phosphohistidine phosphatase SixA
MRRYVTLLLFVMVAVGCGDGGEPGTPTGPGGLPGDPTAEADLLRQVAFGGYVIFFRHAERDANAMATAALAVADNEGACQPGSELTPKGVADAIMVGAAFVRNRVLVDRVYASPTCRTTQMAALAFGAFETTRALTWPDMWSSDERSSLTPQLRELLGRTPARGRNTVLISHNNVLQAARVGLDISLDQSEACVFRPIGNAEFQFVGRISAQRWGEP